MTDDLKAQWCLSAHDALRQAETDFLAAGRQACQDLTAFALQEVVRARARWRDAIEEAAHASNALGDAGVEPADLGLGRPVVDCVVPDRPSPVGDGDLAATPDGVLWVARDGALVDEHDHRMGREEFHAAGGVVLTRGDRWIIVEEALASMFEVGAMVQNPAGDTLQVCASPASSPLSGGDRSPWLATHYHPEGIVHVTGAYHGWMLSTHLDPCDVDP